MTTNEEPSTINIPTADGAPDTTSSMGSPSAEALRPPKKYGFWKKVAYQKLKGWRPVMKAHDAELFFLAAGTLCIALGIPILLAALNVKEYKARYDNVGPMANITRAEQQQLLLEAGDAGVVYTVDVLIEDTMKPPIYVVYSLGNFHQNYRRYVRSYDPNQLHDGDATGIDACLPFKYEGGDPNELKPNNGAILPCGQIAQSNFNDTFAVALNGELLTVDDSDIAWSSDAKHLYGGHLAVNYNIDPASRGGNTTTLPLDKSQHWMVWMRPGGQVPVQKLYGQIDTELPAGARVSVTVANRYNTYGFGGTKHVMLTTNSWVGGKNIFMPSVYIATGVLCYGLALFFFLAYDAGMWRKRQFGHLGDVSWMQDDDIREGGSVRGGATASIVPSQ